MPGSLLGKISIHMSFIIMLSGATWRENNIIWCIFINRLCMTICKIEQITASTFYDFRSWSLEPADINCTDAFWGGALGRTVWWLSSVDTWYAAVCYPLVELIELLDPGSSLTWKRSDGNSSTQGGSETTVWWRTQESLILHWSYSSANF